MVLICYVSAQRWCHAHYRRTPWIARIAEFAASFGEHGEIYIQKKANHYEPFGHTEESAGNTVERPQMHGRHRCSEKPRQQPHPEVGEYEQQGVDQHAKHGGVLVGRAYEEVGDSGTEKSAYQYGCKQGRYGSYLRYDTFHGPCYGGYHYYCEKNYFGQCHYISISTHKGRQFLEIFRNLAV